MNVVGIIPVRMKSSRFPGKPMKKIHGMPMVGHCYHRTNLAPGIQKTFVATCDDEINEYIKSTRKRDTNGTKTIRRRSNS